MKILTDNPFARFWQAWIDGDEEGFNGHGFTEAEAIADLQEQMEEANG